MPRACRQCKASKRRCVETSDGSDATCRTCMRKNIACSKSMPKRNLPYLAPSTSTKLISTTGSNLKNELIEKLSHSPDVTAEFVKNYLHFVHDQPHSLFHVKTLWRDINTAAISESLTNAVWSMGCRFSTDPAHRELGGAFMKKSSIVFAQQLETVSLENIQTCILLANLYAAEQRNDLEALYFGIANRMAHILRLHENHPEDKPVLAEVKRRLWWSLFVADRWSPPGLGLAREMESCDHMLQLPIDELTFQEMEPDQRKAPETCRVGIWRYMVTLTYIVGPIQDLNHLIVRGTSEKQEVDQQVARLADRLQTWYETLPGYMQMNTDNLDIRRGEGLGGPLVALHIGYHHYSTLLYFQYLDAVSHPSADAMVYIGRCRHHALSLSRLVASARAKGDCQLVYLTVAYVTMVSSAVLVHMLVHGEREELETARIQLTCNFEALLELKKYWPKMENITQRLLTFQKACLQSTSSKAYRIDRWMVKFLLEYGLPFNDKEPHDESVQDSTDASASPALTERTNLLDKAFAGLYG